MPVNILHLRDTFEIGGPGKTILETVSHIDNIKYRIHIAVFVARWETSETPFVLEARKKGYSIHIIRSYNQYDPRVVHKTIDLVRQLKIDIIHTHESLSNVVGLLVSRLCRVVIVTTLHGWINNSFKDKLKISFDATILRFFNSVIVVSEAMRKQVVSLRVPSQKVKTLHNSIVIDKYRKDIPEGYIGDLVCQDLKRPIIGAIGRLNAEKGHKDFVKAASIVLGKGYDPTFVIVGDGPEKGNLRRTIESLKVQSNVFLTGYIRDIQSVFRDLQLMVLPSYTEGLPNVALEALLMEVPVVATNVGGTPEIIRNGETGVLIYPASPDQLSDRIIEYLVNPEEFIRMARAGSSLVRKDFSFVNRTKKLEMLYDELMCGKN